MKVKGLVLFVLVFLLSVGMAAAEPSFLHNSPTNGQTLSVSNPTINTTIKNLSADTGWEGLGEVRISLRNRSRIFDTFMMNNTALSGHFWTWSRTNNSIVFQTNGTVLSRAYISGGSAKTQGLNVSNQSSRDLVFYFDSNFTGLTPGLYSLYFWANSSDGSASNSTSESAGTYVNFTVGGANATQVETYLDSVLSGATSNFRNAANDADSTGDILTTSRYSLAITVTADSTVWTTGNFTTPTWIEIGDIAPTASSGVSSTNDPTNAQSHKRGWFTAGDFLPSVNVSWVRALFTGTYDYAYNLSGSASNPTWNTINRFCDSMSSIMSSAAGAETLPCIWRPGDGNTYTLLDSGSITGGSAVASSAGGGGFFSGGGSGYTPRITPSAGKPETPVPASPDQTKPIKEGSWLYENALWVIIGAVVIAGFVMLVLATGSGGSGGKYNNRQRRR